MNSYPDISVHFLFKFELDVDSLGSKRGVDDSEAVSAIVLVFNSPAKDLGQFPIQSAQILTASG